MKVRAEAEGRSRGRGWPGMESEAARVGFDTASFAFETPLAVCPSGSLSRCLTVHQSALLSLSDWTHSSWNCLEATKSKEAS